MSINGHCSRAYKPVDHIPPEVWLEIAKYLSPPAYRVDLLEFGRSTRLFHNISSRILYRDIAWAAWPATDPNAQKTQELHATLEEKSDLYDLVRTIQVNGSLHVKPWYPGILPLSKFQNVQLLKVRGTQFGPSLYCTIARLPSLKTLAILVSHPGEEKDFPPEVRDNPSKSLEKLEIYHPIGTQSPACYLALFTQLHSFTFAAPAKESFPYLISKIISPTLKYLRMFIPDDETAVIFAHFLRTTPQLTELDLRGSSIEKIDIGTDLLPQLHSFAGPPRIAGAFLRARPVWDVTYVVAKSTPPSPVAEHLPSLTWTSIPVTNLAIDILIPWKLEYTKLLAQLIPQLTSLVIECPYVEDLDLWSEHLLPKLPCLRKLRTQIPPGQDTNAEEETIIHSWGEACPTLREVDISGSAHDPYALSFIRWLRENDGIWTSYRYT